MGKNLEESPAFNIADKIVKATLIKKRLFLTGSK